MKIHYFNSNPKTLGFNHDFYKTLFGHTINEKNNDVLIKPIKFNKVSLSPSNILGLKKTYNIKEIHMYDRIRGIEQDVLITDHINRSGLFFLRGKTPHEGFQMFPDMSNVYEKKCKYVFLGGSSTETRWVDEKDRWVAQIDNYIKNVQKENQKNILLDELYLSINDDIIQFSGEGIISVNSAEFTLTNADGTNLDSMTTAGFSPTTLTLDTTSSSIVSTGNNTFTSEASNSLPIML